MRKLGKEGPESGKVGQRNLSVARFQVVVRFVGEADARWRLQEDQIGSNVPGKLVLHQTAIGVDVNGPLFSEGP